MMECGETEEYLRSILRYSDDAIFSSDSDGRLVTFSTGAERILGYSPTIYEHSKGKLGKIFFKDKQKLLDAAAKAAGSGPQRVAVFPKGAGMIVLK